MKIGPPSIQCIGALLGYCHLYTPVCQYDGRGGAHCHNCHHWDPVIQTISQQNADVSAPPLLQVLSSYEYIILLSYIWFNLTIFNEMQY